MRKFINRIIAIACLTLFTIALISCPQDTGAKSGADFDASKISVNVAGKTVVLKGPAASLAAAGEAVLRLSFQELSSTYPIIITTGSEKYIAEYGKITGGNDVAWRKSGGLPFKHGDILAVKVTAHNDTIRYFKIFIYIEMLGALSIAGVQADPGISALKYSDIGSPGSVVLSNLAAGSAEILPLLASDATFKTAIAGASGITPEWNDSISHAYSFADGDILYIEVTAEGGQSRQIYKIREPLKTQYNPILLIKNKLNKIMLK